MIGINESGSKLRVGFDSSVANGEDHAAWMGDKIVKNKVIIGILAHFDNQSHLYHKLSNFALPGLWQMVIGGEMPSKNDMDFEFHSGHPFLPTHYVLSQPFQVNVGAVTPQIDYGACYCLFPTSCSRVNSFEFSRLMISTEVCLSFFKKKPVSIELL